MFLDWLKIVFGRLIMYAGYLFVIASLIAFGQSNNFGGKLALGIGILLIAIGSFLKHYFRNKK